MPFTKHGSIFTITDSNQIKTASDWSDIISTRKTSTAEGVKIHDNLMSNDQSNVVCNIDVDNYVYIHTTIMASVDVQPDSDYWITKETEKYINTNGDAWERNVLLNDYPTFVQNGIVYVEHDQNPERAKGKVLDAIAREMNDTILIDLLFCVDNRHKDLVHNILTGIANAVSMGCTTKYTICSICGNVAHDEKEYCIHIKNYKNQMIKCADGVYRKCCELCFENSFYDCSIVANPAFAGAVFRKLVASNNISAHLLSNILCKQINSGQFENELLKVATVKTSSHPIEKREEKTYEIEDEFADIPYRDPHNIKDEFEKQLQEQEEKSTKKTATQKCADYGNLVILSDRYDVPSTDRKANMLFNFISKDTVGRLVGRQADTCAIFFAKIGMVQNIPSNIVHTYSFGTQITKQAKKLSDDDLVINRQGQFLDGDCFQILKLNDDSVEVRWMTGTKMGQKENVPRKEFTDSINWATVNELAKFAAVWNGKIYQIKMANWNERYASILNEFETHIDNVQHDITCTMPKQNGQKYSKSFGITTKFGSTILKFDAKVDNEKLDIDVKSVNW